MNGATISSGPPIILIADDTPANLAVVVENLEMQGYQVVIAQDGEEAVRRAKFAHPDLILMDVVMPGPDGFTACRQLKASPATRDIPVIFMTALADTESKIRGFEAGGVDYVAKPFETAEVLARVNTHLAVSAMRSALAAQNAQLQRETAERREAEEKLRRLNMALEERVSRRTAELEAANRELRMEIEARKRMEARVGRLVDSNIIGVLFWDINGVITEANDAFLGLVGYSRDELVSVRWTEMTPPEYRAADERAIAQLNATGRCKPFEKEFLRKDGGRVPVLVAKAFLEGSRQEGVGFVLDLTERKQAERRQKLLLDEINHRVKNTLATVQAIAAHTLRTAESPARFVAALEARLMALSQAHNLLTLSNWQGADLREVLRQELAPHADGDDHRVVLEGPDVRLDPVATVTLGMAFHELATNAAKYGALSVATGRVHVQWTVDAGRRLHMEWTETGGPPVPAPRRRGFGSRLIERGLARELAGEVHLDFPPEGVRCTMDMALDRVSMH